MLDTKQQQELVTQLTNQYCDQPINNIGDICRDVNLVQLSRFCGNMTNLSNSHLEVEVTRLLAKYNSVQHIVTDMVSTADLRPPDNYLVLASVGHVEHHQGGEVLPAVHGLVVHQVVHQSIQLADETDVDQSNERGGSRGSLLLYQPVHLRKAIPARRSCGGPGFATRACWTGWA